MEWEHEPDAAEPAARMKSLKHNRWRRPIVLIPAGLLVLLGLAYGADVALAGKDIPRGTTVSGVRVGGMSRTAVEQTLDRAVATELARERNATAGSAKLTVAPTDAGITLDVAATLDAAGGQPLNPITRLISLFGGERDVEPVLAVDRAALAAAVADYAEAVDTDPVDGAIAIEGTTAVAVPPVDGQRLDPDAAADRILDAVRRDETALDLPVDPVAPNVTAELVQQTLDEFATPALAGSVTAVGPADKRVEIPVAAIATALRFEPGTDHTLVPSLDAAALAEALGDALAPFSTDPVDAGFTITGGTVAVVPAVDGTAPDVPAMADALLEVLPQPAPREIALPVIAEPAELTTENARGYGITEQISSFTTYFTNEDSGENIRVVAAEVDGAVVPPGETFSLNGYTGPRTEAQGYVESTIIQDGEFVQAVGGGISQFATTMFNAVFFAGLADVTHKPHSYYISRYPAGREATVFYDSIDLAWRNDSDAAVYVQTSWEPGAITVTFWGTKHFEIESVSGERNNYTEPETERKPDDSECVPQSGSSGFDISVSRVFRPVGGGDVLRTEVFNTRYNAVPTIVCVPPGGNG